MKEFKYNNQTWFWNGFGGFFFQPVGPKRKKERIVESGWLYEELRAAAGYP